MLILSNDSLMVLILKLFKGTPLVLNIDTFGFFKALAFKYKFLLDIVGYNRISASNSILKGSSSV